MCVRRRSDRERIAHCRWNTCCCVVCFFRLGNERLGSGLYGWEGWGVCVWWWWDKQAETCNEMCDNGALLSCVYSMCVFVSERNDVGRYCVGQG